jgi:hypothetical protein
MLNAMTYNYLVWENPENIPFPSEVREILKQEKLPELKWQAMGLPINGATYALTGKQLYLQELFSGEPAVNKQDFTGDVYFGNYFQTDDPEGNNYFVYFVATFLKGELVEITLDKTVPHAAKVYKAAAEEINSKVRKLEKRRNSWWFKWLYMPYKWVVCVAAAIIVWVLRLFEIAISRFALFITPYE